MALFICVPVHRPRSIAVLSGWNGIGGPLGCNILADRLCSVRLISKDVTSLDVDLLEQRYSMGGIMISAGRERMKASGLPKPSTKVWIFVFLPPLDIPTALFSLFFPTLSALMYLAGCRVNGNVLKIRINGKCLKNCFKHPELLPFAKAAIDCLPRAISFRQFSPRRPSSGNPQHPIQCCGYHILPGVLVSLPLDVLAAAYPWFVPTRFLRVHTVLFPCVYVTCSKLFVQVLFFQTRPNVLTITYCHHN